VIPAFIRQDHTIFVKLLKAFYEWGSSEGGAIKNIREFQNFRNIDYVVDQFYEQIGYELLAGVPPTTQEINKAVFVQRIKDFYITRGSEESFDFMFRYLYDEAVEIQYPKETLLRVDCGAYIQKSVMRTVTSQQLANYAKLQFLKLVGLTSGAYGFIEAVSFFDEFDVKYTEWSLANSVGTFLVGETLQVTEPTSGNVIQEVVVPSISGITITDPGKGYTVEDAILHNDQIFFMNSAITSVDEDGGIKSTRFEYAPIVHNLRQYTNYALHTETFSSAYWTYPGYIDIVGSTKGKCGGNRPLAYISKGATDTISAVVDLSDKTSDTLTIQFILKPKMGTTTVGTSVGGTYVWGKVSNQIVLAGTKNVHPSVTCKAYLLNDGYYLLVTTISSHSNTDNTVNIKLTGTANTIWPIQGMMVTDGATYEAYLPTEDGPITAFQSPLFLRPDATLALFKTNIESLVKLPGYYDNTKGLLSDANNLHDGYYYQEFSYVLTSSKGIAEYENIIKDTVHPAGMKMFGTVLIEESMQLTTAYDQTCKIIQMGSYRLQPPVLNNDKGRHTKFLPHSTASVLMTAIETEITPYTPTT
jgi:hypothetical protein